jgi:uncharacterized glyoxalase superfamily protein PhnB
MTTSDQIDSRGDSRAQGVCRREFLKVAAVGLLAGCRAAQQPTEVPTEAAISEAPLDDAKVVLAGPCGLYCGICSVTNNVAVLADFYAKVLGVKTEGNDVHVELNTEGAGIAIFSAEGMESMAPRSMQGAGCGSFTTMFEVEDVDAEYERLKALDVEFVMPPTTHPWGARSFWFRDPDGNIVDFFANLAE